MLISRVRKFIFIHIYKNAGNSITYALRPFATSKWQRLANRWLEGLGCSYFDPQPYHSHIKASELIKLMGEKSFKRHFSFAIVRNPWDWQVSFYTYMLRSETHRQHDLVKELGSFDEYIRWRCTEEVRFQKDFVCSVKGDLLVDFIGRFENLGRDFQTICSRIGISATLPHLNVSNTTPYQEYYNEETRELVRKTFEPDISLFGYEF